MKNHRYGSLLSALALGAGLSACGPQVSDNPTWADDIRPLLVSRCTRCHNASALSDPTMPAGLQATPIQSYDDFDYVNLTDLPLTNLGILKTAGTLITTPGPRFMPPPPAAALADWQIQTLQNWLKENPQL